MAQLTVESVEKTKSVAEKESPPKARSRKGVDESCQGRCLRVVKKLVKQGIIEGGKIGLLKGMMEGFDNT